MNCPHCGAADARVKLVFDTRLETEVELDPSESSFSATPVAEFHGLSWATWTCCWQGVSLAEWDYLDWEVPMEDVVGGMTWRDMRKELRRGR